MAVPSRELRLGDAARAYAVSAALWGAAAAALLAWVVATLALGWPVPVPALGVGRVLVAGQHLAWLGGVSLAVAGGLLRIAGAATSGREDRRIAAGALAAWNVGLVACLASDLLFGVPAEPAVPPVIAAALFWVGGALWCAAFWRLVTATKGPLPVSLWFGISASLGLVVSLSAALLVPFVDGAGQAVAGAVFGRSLAGSWAIPGSLAIAAAAVPASVGKPLFGRRAALLAWATWFVLVPAASARDLAPDLLPAWLARWSAAATVLQVVPAVLVAVAIAGTLVGGAPRWPAGPSALLAAGAAAVAAAMVADASAAAFAAQGARFSAWSSAAPVPATLAATTILAAGASYVAHSGLREGGYRVRLSQHLALVLGAAIATAAARAALGVAEIAGGAAAWLSEGSADLVATGSVLLLPGCLLGLAGAGVWAANLATAARAPSASVDELPGGSSGAPGVPAIAGFTVVAGSIAVLVCLFLPLAMPSMVAPSDRAAARAMLAGGTRASGRATYVAEGCVVCHTQRVRAVAADAAFGPPTRAGDYAGGPALAGHRRWGPDLSWVGDRYPDRAPLADRLDVHGPGGVPPYPWLFGDDGPTRAGIALVDYLHGLSSRGAAR